MIASHRLHHDPHNGGGSYVTLGDLVEMIETFTGYEVNGLRDLPYGTLRLTLDAPIVAFVITDGGARFEGRIEHLTLRVGNGSHDPTKEGTDV
jgi:hypothetical protein